MVEGQPYGNEEGGNVDEEVEDGEAMAIVDGHSIAGMSKYWRVEHIIHTTQGILCLLILW